MTSQWFLGGAFVVSLFVFAVVSCPAQSTSLPPYHPSPQSPLPANSPASLGKSGLQANSGSIIAGVYNNSVYGFSLQIPPGWVVMPAKDVTPVKPVKASAGPTMPSEPNHVLLLVTENAPLKQSYQRSSIQVVATRLTNQIAAASPSGYLTYSRQAAKEQGLAVQYLSEPKDVSIGGRKVSEIGLVDKTGGGARHVAQYVTIDKNVLMQFLLVSPDEAGLKELQPYIQSLRFKAETRKSVTKTKK